MIGISLEHSQNILLITIVVTSFLPSFFPSFLPPFLLSFRPSFLEEGRKEGRKEGKNTQNILLITIIVTLTYMNFKAGGHLGLRQHPKVMGLKFKDTVKVSRAQHIRLCKTELWGARLHRV